ncbi:MAG: hypothetical protein RLZZ28_455 [Bacteroidota bacterium]
MKTNETKSADLVKVKKSTLLSLVADKLKGRTLFPEKVEAARKYLKGNQGLSA